MLQIVSLPSECTKFCKSIILPKNLLDEANYRFKTTVNKQLLKTLGTYLFCQCNQSKKTFSVEFEGPLFMSHWCMNKDEYVHNSV